MLTTVAEYSDEEFERIVISVDERGNRTILKWPRHTEEEKKKIEERMKEGIRETVRRMIELKGYEWTREHLEAKD